MIDFKRIISGTEDGWWIGKHRGSERIRMINKIEEDIIPDKTQIKVVDWNVVPVLNASYWAIIYTYIMYINVTIHPKKIL